jgi:3-hydroxyacyl-CoA dehydrogenase
MPATAVVGAGLIGRSWAIVFARAGHEVRLVDVEVAAVTRALEWLGPALDELATAGLLDEPAANVRRRIRAVGSLADAVAGAELVQENARETLDAKRAVARAIDRVASDRTIIASSTSTITASAISEDLPGRSRFLVAHPVNPPHLVPLVELAPAPWTDGTVVDRARAGYTTAGMVPVTVQREIAGFLLNRLQAAVLAEAYRLYEDGIATAEDLDRTMRDGLGLRWALMGPFETIDLNAPGGIADYMDRYGSLMHGLANGSDARPWAAPTIARLEAERRQRLAADGLAERARWRDRRLASLVAWRRTGAATDDPG